MFKQSFNLALASLLGLFSLTATAQEPVVMGYWENWGTYQNFPMPGNAQGSTNAVLTNQITGLNALAYAFLEVANDGAIQFADVWSDLDPKSAQDKRFCNASPQSCKGFPEAAGLGNFAAFTKTAVAHHVISVGGAGHDIAWENAFNNPDNFVNSLKLLLSVYGQIDWLDIDYEPVGGMPAQNIKRFVALVAKIKQAIPTLTVSYTIPANANSINNFGRDNWQSLMANVNYVSLMGYDLHGVFDTQNPLTALHSALVADASDFSDESAVQALNNMGVSNSKIILGVPFYGRAVGGVQMPGLGQVFTQAVKGDLDDNNCSLTLNNQNTCSGMIQYKTLVAQNYAAVPVVIKNVVAGVYAYNAEQKTFVAYDNVESVTAKANYAKTNNLAGVMFWSLRFDKPVDDGQSLLAAIDKVYGIKPNNGGDASMKLQLTNNDPNNPITITLVPADKSNYYAFPQLTNKGQAGSDVTYTDTNSASVKSLMSQNGVLVLLTPNRGNQVWCPGSLNFTSGSYHHVQVYYDATKPSCALN